MRTNAQGRDIAPTPKPQYAYGICGKVLKSNHGMLGTSLYASWVTMRARCMNPKHDKYQYYGARGIKICPEWLGSFAAFRDWAQANGHREGLQIDRRDVHGNYEPSNCRWATRQQNIQNQRKRRTKSSSRFIGVSICGSKWRAQIHGCNRPTHIGLYLTEEEAAIAYDAAALERYGEFAPLNFPNNTKPGKSRPRVGAAQ